ncbi:hypothetical protein CupriaWKF_22410 [Cupriavidus sp. WKF15]|uniref:hypothetical protein n=1 Tax=Cupriavidus sp. WKF15 TaxID=3032282 RepID=UPI0023E2013F|nr:hypothetical protein [Cupriavidus sp. WKF15]WER49872.1 hypothetical protein CupriaWKF_22410 [Cupriavidus sp. WKF15]
MLSPMFHALRAASVAMLLAAASSAVFAAPADGKPLVLDTQSGISDGKRGGTGLQTGPLSPRDAAGSHPGMTPDASQYPVVVAPYIEVPVGGSRPPYPAPRPRPTPHTP